MLAPQRRRTFFIPYLSGANIRRTPAARLGRATFRPRTVRATVGLACSFVVRFAIVRFSERAFAFGSLSCALANVRSRSVRYGPNSQAKTNLIQHRVTTDSEYPSLH